MELELQVEAIHGEVILSITGRNIAIESKGIEIHIHVMCLALKFTSKYRNILSRVGEVDRLHKVFSRLFS